MRDKNGYFIKGNTIGKRFQKGHKPAKPFEKGNTPWNKTTGIIKKCLKCNKVFRVPLSLNRVNYCSRSCSKKGKPSPRKGVKLSKETRKKMRITSLQCAPKGDKHYKWKGGRSRGYKTGYYSTRYRNWRTAVFTRDNFQCKDCGAKHIYLTAHHIKSFAKYPELRFDINNGITLCEPCHKLTDNYKGRANYV